MNKMICSSLEFAPPSPMTDGQPLDYVNTYNKDSLKILARALTFATGQFSLVLVRCNYEFLQKRMLQDLQQYLQTSTSDHNITQIVLPSKVNSLYDCIVEQVTDAESIALMVCGFELVKDLARVLKSTNQMREEFRKNFEMPVVFWVSDEVLEKLIRFAPEFKSWAACSIKFEIGSTDLINIIRTPARELINQYLTADPEVITNDIETKHPNLPRLRREILSATKDCQTRGIKLEPSSIAGAEFVLGLEAFQSNQLETSINHYLKSWGLWQEAINQWQQRQRKSFTNPYLLSQAIVLYHLGLCYWQKANEGAAEKLHYLRLAESRLQQSLEIYTKTGRLELVAKYSDALGEVLRQLQAWQKLLKLAQNALILAHTHGMTPQLARYYGFLAEVSLHRGQWEEAKWAAREAINISAQLPLREQKYHGLFLFLLAKALRASSPPLRGSKTKPPKLAIFSKSSFIAVSQTVNRQTEIINYLQEALTTETPSHDCQLHINIFQQLADLYFETGDYLQAFRSKQQLRTIEHQYGRRAFIGAGQLQPEHQSSTDKNKHFPAISSALQASQRNLDVKRLLQRLSRNDCKLTLLHGKSGVGKSSLVNAGLVPSLQAQLIGDKLALPVVTRVYTDWKIALVTALQRACTEQKVETLPQAPVVQDPQVWLTEQLQKNARQNLLTILIFDQFEEFFFAVKQDYKKNQLDSFIEFIKICLNLPFIKIIISLREDYLHYLLEWERFGGLDAVNNNILDKDIRYHVGHFSKQDTKEVILALTQRSQLFLEENLIDTLVEDLADKSGKIKPIELQVVGAQLQEEKITTQQQYQEKGPKIKLVERWLKQVIADCGPENEKTAWEILGLLTSNPEQPYSSEETSIRPLKTKTEIASDLTISQEKLNLILEILVGSGLLFLHREKPDDSFTDGAIRYQLVHDYLVQYIRKEQEMRVNYQRKQQLKKTEQQKLLYATSGLFFLLLAFLIGGFWIRAEALKQKAEMIRKKAEIAEIDANIRAKVAYSELLYASNQKLEALLESLRAENDLNKAQETANDNKIRVVTSLQQAVYGVQERNRLEGHHDSIWSVKFSPDGQFIASGGNDKMVKLWHPDGTLLATLQGHSESVTRVSFSPDSQLLASASRDKSVRLWNIQDPLHPYLQKTLFGHKDFVFGVAFSPDGEVIATASKDQTVKLWKPDSTQIATLEGHEDAVNFVTFSPDGKVIASASNDGTVKLWRRDGKLLKSWRAHDNWVLGVTFSPDGELIATAGRDNLVKLWTKDGEAVQTFTGHQSAVYGVSFSPNNQLIASASDDQTVKLWSLNGKLLETFSGHSGRVTELSFSPDGQFLASSSLDKTVKLWVSEPVQVPRATGHTDRVTSIKFSPNGKVFVTGSRDKTLKLWTRQGKLIKTLAGHTDRVTSVAFSPDGELIASVSLDKTVKLWSSQGVLLKSFLGASDAIYAVKFSPDGRFIATGSKDKLVKLWNLQGELVQTFVGHKDRVYGLAFSSDGTKIASASDDMTVKVWSWQGELLKTLAGEDGHLSYVTSVSFSPDNQLIATGSWDNTVKLWPLTGEKPKTLLKGYSDSVTSVRFSPDNHVLASASWDGRVKLWNLDGVLLKELKWSNGGVLDIDFSPDGQVLAAATAENQVILWNLDLENLVGQACGWLGDYLRTNPHVSTTDRSLCSSGS